MAQNALKKSPLDEAGTPQSHESEDLQGDEGLPTVIVRGPRQLPLVGATPAPAEGAGVPLEHHSEEAREAPREKKPSGGCCCGSCGSGVGTPPCQDTVPSLEGEARPRNCNLALREAAPLADCVGKDSRSGSSNGDTPSLLKRAQERPLFCSVGVHSLTPNKPAARKRTSSGQRPRQQQQREQHLLQMSDVAAGDSQREGDEARNGARCAACGTLKVRAPIGFNFMQNPAPSWGQLRMATCAEAPEAEAAATPGASVPLGTSGPHRKQLSAEDCPWTLPVGGPTGGGSYHLVRQQQQQPRQGEFVAGSLQWGQPTSFWLVESVKDEGVEREFRRLFRINSPVSRRGEG